MSEITDRLRHITDYDLLGHMEIASEAALELDHLQAELAKHRWIPVSEGLPEKGVYILVYCPRTQMISEVFANDGVDFANTYTHWKPITLPKGGE